MNSRDSTRKLVAFPLHDRVSNANHVQPCHILLAALIGRANDRQQQIIEFQNDQIEALLTRLGKKRLLLTDDQRRVLAVKGHGLGPKALLELTTIVTPDTILRWHRKLVAKNRDHSDKRKTVDRPCIRQVILNSILRFARENPTRGYDRIQGALANIGYHIADSTVANVLINLYVNPTLQPLVYIVPFLMSFGMFAMLHTQGIVKLVHRDAERDKRTGEWEQLVLDN